MEAGLQTGDGIRGIEIVVQPDDGTVAGLKFVMAVLRQAVKFRAGRFGVGNRLNALAGIGAAAVEQRNLVAHLRAGRLARES